VESVHIGPYPRRVGLGGLDLLGQLLPPLGGGGLLRSPTRGEPRLEVVFGVGGQGLELGPRPGDGRLFLRQLTADPVADLGRLLLSQREDLLSTSAEVTEAGRLTRGRDEPASTRDLLLQL